MSTLSETSIARLTEIFRVLGDPTRVRILDALVERERSVGDLANGLGVTPSAVSHQLRLLRGARIVRSRRSGRSVFYALDDSHVLALYQEGLRHALEDQRGGAR